MSTVVKRPDDDDEDAFPVPTGRPSRHRRQWEPDAEDIALQNARQDEAAGIPGYMQLDAVTDPVTKYTYAVMSWKRGTVPTHLPDYVAGRTSPVPITIWDEEGRQLQRRR